MSEYRVTAGGSGRGRMAGSEGRMSDIRCWKCGRIATEEMGWLATWRLVSVDDGDGGHYLVWVCNPSCDVDSLKGKT